MSDNENKSGCAVILYGMILVSLFITIFWAIPGGMDSIATGGSFWEGAKGMVAFNIFAVIIGAIAYLVIKDFNDQ